MGQLTQNIIFFNDSVGNIAPASRHFFYEAGTSTPKAVYSDPELTTPIDQPVLADSAGFLPQIWLESGAITRDALLTNFTASIIPVV